MTASDLMVGDFVRANRELVKILNIDSYTGVWDGREGVVCESIIFGHTLSCPVDRLIPIRITQTILEMNFKKHSEICFPEWRSEDGRIVINALSNMKDRYWHCHIDNEDFQTICSADVEYVHELQHIFHLAQIQKEIEL